MVFDSGGSRDGEPRDPATAGSANLNWIHPPAGPARPGGGIPFSGLWTFAGIGGERSAEARHRGREMDGRGARAKC